MLCGSKAYTKPKAIAAPPQTKPAAIASIVIPELTILLYIENPIKKNPKAQKTLCKTFSNHTVCILS